MKKIYLNLKRFDIPASFDGINKRRKNETYGKEITEGIEKMNLLLPVTIFFQEANLLSALSVNKNVHIGCQSVHYQDVSKGGNFGAFTTFRTAKSMRGIGVSDTLIGHCEERNYLNYLFAQAGGQGDINKILNEEIKRAQEAGLEVLYCIGEKAEEQDHKYDVLRHQLEVGLEGVDLSKITIAYEPVWAIGPGKVPPGREYIEDIAKFVKSVVNVPVVYGGGLKIENAEMIASIPEVDGGLIALTKFGADFGFTLEDFEKIVLTYEKGLKKWKLN